MGVKEYENLRKTLLNVKDLATSRKSLENSIQSMKKEQRKLANQIEKEASDLENLENKYSTPKRAKARKKIASLKREIAEFESELATVGGGAVLFVLLAAISGILGGLYIELVPEDEGLASMVIVDSLCCFIPIGLLFMSAAGSQFADAEEKSIKGKVRYRKKKVKMIRGDLSKLETKNDSFSDIEIEFEKKSGEIEKLEEQIKDIDLKINSLMDSVAHLIPYADQID